MVKRTVLGIEFELRDGPEPALFLFGIRKSGSSIMNSMLNAVCSFNGKALVDLPGTMFKAGIKSDTWRNAPQLADFFVPGNIYAGFRDAPDAVIAAPAFAGARGILLVRDPRDALCSEYFSNAYSHAIPPDGDARAQMLQERAASLAASIEEFARRKALKFRETMQGFLPILSNPGFRLYRYEQAIMDKRWFLRDAAAHLGLTATEHEIDLILGWADVMPEVERPDQFIRRVRPGDHRDKFSPALIADLNEVFAAELAAFGYQP